MLTNIGFYFIFLFKLLLMGFLSLIIGYLYRKDEDAKSLKMFSIISLIIVSLVAIADNYALNRMEILTFYIPAVFILLYIFTYKESKLFIMKYMVLFSVSIFIGLGYYISAITFIAFLILIEFMFDGIFDFFISDDKKDLEEDYLGIDEDDLNIIDKE
tara:strand:+ start:470 stop:943 length:474 start_codon:yes stop_codon:yes gene_type:complete